MFGISRELDAFWAGVIFGVILIAYFFITHVQEDGGPERWRRWLTAFIMWSDHRSAAVRAQIEPVRAGGSTGSNDPVPGLLNQVEPVEPQEIEPVREPVILHNLSRAALIALLAVQKNDSNGYRFSKNQIAAFVGGTKADILKEIDLYRDPQPAKQPVPTRADRPVNGWN